MAMRCRSRAERVWKAVAAVAILAVCGWTCPFAVGLGEREQTIGYENRLFDSSRVHTIDLVMDDWEDFLSTCTKEEYEPCALVIDGERMGTVAIRAKGNTSLSSVEAYGNNRYSFKVELDHYEAGKSYHGLDKLSLNNLIQDSTCMKDYLAYTLMGRMGVAAPLCSFVRLNVNGAYWGLYLAVDGVEESFLKRNYGSASGELYKPDSLSFGGGRGHGQNFDMDGFQRAFPEGEAGNGRERRGDGSLPEGMEPPEGQSPPAERTFPEGKNPPEGRGTPEGQSTPEGGGMGADDVCLRYIDDNPDSYANIFDHAKTDLTEADQKRLIASLRRLGEGDSSVVNTEAVIRYLVTHQFLCNDDSYTGMMVHNYYLYERNGVLEMIPWDYNLAFGGFGMSGADATSTVNAPIDSPVASGELSSRPMVAWIFSDETFTRRYHEVYAGFVETCLMNGWLDQEIERVSALIAPYVAKDPTAFCTYETFLQAVETLRAFCDLRAQSVAGQLDGSVPSTVEGQRDAGGQLVDASHLNLSDMGGFSRGGGGFGGPGRGARGRMPGPEERVPARANGVWTLAFWSLLLLMSAALVRFVPSPR